MSGAKTAAVPKKKKLPAQKNCLSGFAAAHTSPIAKSIIQLKINFYLHLMSIKREGGKFRRWFQITCHRVGVRCITHNGHLPLCAVSLSEDPNWSPASMTGSSGRNVSSAVCYNNRVPDENLMKSTVHFAQQECANTQNQNHLATLHAHCIIHVLIRVDDFDQFAVNWRAICVVYYLLTIHSHFRATCFCLNSFRFITIGKAPFASV